MNGNSHPANQQSQMSQQQQPQMSQQQIGQLASILSGVLNHVQNRNAPAVGQHQIQQQPIQQQQMQQQQMPQFQNIDPLTEASQRTVQVITISKY